MLTLSMSYIHGQKFLLNSYKAKWVYGSYKKAFEGAGSWSFGNSFTRTVKILGLI